MRPRLLLVFFLFALGGCAVQPVAPVVQPVQPELSAFAMNGRISIKQRDRRDSAGLRWSHLAQTDEILLLTPLGQTAARIYRNEKQATLEDGDRLYQDQDVESLMTQVLGWRLQLDSLHHWVLGIATEKDGQIERDSAGRLAVLHQDGWEVRYLRYADDKPDSLPTRLQLTRENLQVLLLIDEWEWK